jgi:hypothetical protein
MCLHGCASKSIWKPTSITTLNSVSQDTEINSYPLDLSVGEITSSSFKSVDVEYNIVMSIDMTNFGTDIKKYFLINIVDAKIFSSVTENVGALYFEGNVTNLRAKNAGGGTFVSGELKGRILSNKGGDVLWETTVYHEILISYNKYQGSFGNEINNSFSQLSQILAQKLVIDMGSSNQLANIVESKFSINVLTIAKKAAAKRLAAAEKADKVASEKAISEKAAKENDVKVAAEKIAADKADAEKTASALLAAERAVAEKIAADKATAEKTAAENSAATLAAEKAAVEGGLSVIGLFPGISTQQQVEFAKADYGYIIGGYELFCIPQYEEGKLYTLTCVTGKENLSRDRVSGSNALVSNIEVYNTLIKGFTKKFGNPKTAENQLRNSFGVKYISELAAWNDKKGNELSLISIGTNIDSGALILSSAKKIKADKEAELQANKAREF